MTFVESMLGAPAGTTVSVTPDLLVVNDGGTYTALEQVQTLCAPEKVRAIYDHDVPTGRPEGSRIFGILKRFAQQYGIPLLQAKGVGYSYLLRTQVKPGQIVLQGGRHAGIYGSVGALGISCGADVLSQALEKGSFSMTVPETVYVQITGSLGPDVSAMDAAMLLLRECPMLPGRAVEFHAPTLAPDEQAVLCAMAGESGAVTASVSDTDRCDFRLCLDQVVPMVTMPCAAPEEQNTAVRQPLSQLEGIAFQAGQIGGYTGGTIEELRKAARLMQGKRLAHGFRLSIVPATSEDYLLAMEEGLLTRFIDYGAQIQAVGDRSIVVQGAGAIGSGERLLSTGLYTYAGCMGVENSFVYTASTQSVVKASMAKEEEA